MHRTGAPSCLTCPITKGVDIEVGGSVDVWLFGAPPGYSECGEAVAPHAGVAEAVAHLDLSAQFGAIAASASEQRGSLAGALRRALFSSRPDPPEARSGAADAEMGPAPPPTEAREGCGSSSRTPRLRVLQLCHRGELKTAAAVRAWLKRARLQAELVQVEA